MVVLAAAVAASIALVGPAPGTGAAAAASAVPAMPTAMPTAQVPAPPIAAQTATTPPSTAQMIDGQVTVSVDSLAPEVITAGQDLTISGTIANGTGEPLEDCLHPSQTMRPGWHAVDRGVQEPGMRVIAGVYGERPAPQSA